MAQGAGRQSGRGAAGTVAGQRALGRSRRQTKHRRIVSLRRSPNARPSAAAAATKIAANGNEQCGNVAAGCGRRGNSDDNGAYAQLMKIATQL